MAKLKIHTFGVTLDARFPKPVAFLDARTNEFAAKMSEIFQLTPDQFRMRQFDILYGYELKATFLGSNARLERTSTGIKLTLEGATSAEHRDSITDLLSTYCAAILPEVGPKLTFVITAHATFESPESYVAFFKPYGRCPEVVSEGIIAELKLPDWTEPVGVRFENSLAFKDAAFVVHSSEISLPLDSSSLKRMWASFEESTKLFGLEISYS